jgi:hypothetical protein
MRSWARRAATATLVAVAFAAAGGGLSGTAFAGTGGGVPAGLGGNGLLAPANIPADVCGDASALLGIALAGCRGGAVASVAKPHATASAEDAHIERPRDSSASTVLPSTVLQGAAMSEPASSGLRQAFSDTLNAPGLGAGTTDNPAASRSAALGTLPDLADLPSLSGLTNLSARGAPGSSTLMSTSALTAADAPGMSSDSFAALAIGALLAGAAALKIASRRARDHKAGIGATI